MTTTPRPEGPISQSVERLRSELDRWLDAAWSQGERAIDAIGLRTGKTWTPPIDVIETPDVVRVLVNLPGVQTSDIDLTIAGHMLTVGGTLPSVELGDDAEPHLHERVTGEFRRVVPLPASVDPDKIDAVCEHGVLSISVAKCEQLKPRKIPVNAGGRSE